MQLGTILSMEYRSHGGVVLLNNLAFSILVVLRDMLSVSVPETTLAVTHTPDQVAS